MAAHAIIQLTDYPEGRNPIFRAVPLKTARMVGKGDVLQFEHFESFAQTHTIRFDDPEFPLLVKGTIERPQRDPYSAEPAPAFELNTAGWFATEQEARDAAK